jgi:Fic family protein
MDYFAKRFAEELAGGITVKVIAFATSHHRFNYIHPFPDGNGRVSRLMSHAISHQIGIGCHGLWSISRGLARGLKDKSEYKAMMDLADSPRRDDTDGRGNLSRKALVQFVEWFLKISLDQIQFMTLLFDINNLGERLKRLVAQSDSLRPEASHLLQQTLVRGQIERGEAPAITGLPERTARRVLDNLESAGLLASSTPKGPVSLRFPIDTREILFPKLFQD